MIRYRCDYCGAYFDEPLKIPYRETVGEFTREYVDEVCPVCFCDSLTAEEEEQLDDWMDGDSIKSRREWK